MEKRTSLWQIRKWKWTWGLETSDPDFEDRDFQKIWWAVLEGQHADESRLGLATDDSESGKITPTRKGKSPKHGVSVFEGFSMEFTRLGPEKGNRLLYSLNILVWRTSGVKSPPRTFGNRPARAEETGGDGIPTRCEVGFLWANLFWNTLFRDQLECPVCLELMYPPIK